MRLALAQFGVRRPAGLDDFLDRVAATAYDARNGGASFLVLPENTALILAGAFVTMPDVGAEVAVTAEHADALIDGFRDIAADTGLWLLAGTVPARLADGRLQIRAPLIAPDGRCLFQDKRQPTWFETEQWAIAPGDAPGVIDTPFGRIGISIGYDVEFPLHVRAQVAAGAELILVPGCTDSLAGFHRVRLSARARAIENQCFVATAPLVGAAPWSGVIDENRGFAGLYGPADVGFPQNGVLARGNLDEPGLIYAEVDFARLAEVRRHGTMRNHQDWPDIPPAPLRAFTG